MTITEREYSTPIVGNKSLAFKKQQRQHPQPRQPHFNFETVPFWFSNEEPTHVKEIIKTYSEHLHLNYERPKNSRAPMQFIGRVARRPELFDKEQQLFETLDLISVFELKCVCEGRTMPLVVQYKLRTRWNTDEGLPSSTKVLTSCKPGAEIVRIQQGQNWGNIASCSTGSSNQAQSPPQSNCPSNCIHSPSSPLFNLKPLSASMNRSSTLLDLQVEEELNNSSCDESSPAIPRDASSINRSYMKPSYLYSLPELGYTEVITSTQIYKYFVSNFRLRVGYADLQSQAQAHFYLDSHAKITKTEPKDCMYLKNEEDIEYVDDDATDLLSFSDDHTCSNDTKQTDQNAEEYENEFDDDDDDTVDTFILQVTAPFDDDNCGTADEPHLQLLLQCNFGTQGVTLNAGLHFDDEEDDDDDYDENEQEDDDEDDEENDDDEDDEDEEDSDDDSVSNTKCVPQQQVRTCSPLQGSTARQPSLSSGKIYCK